MCENQFMFLIGQVHHKVDLRFKDMVSGKPGKGATGVLKKKKTKK